MKKSVKSQKSSAKKIAGNLPLVVKDNVDMHVEDQHAFRHKSDNTILQQIFKVGILRSDSSKGFRFLDGVNRSVIPSHVTKMAESVNRIGITRPVTVGYFDYKGTKDYYVIDGQNLYHALLRLGSHIPYRVIEIDSEEDMVEKIALLNTSSKTWALTDYVTAWSYIRPDYKKLGHFYNVYDLELSTIASVLYGYAGTSATNIIKVIKEGRFRIGNVDKAIQILDHTTDVLNIVPRLDRNANRAFVSAYTAFVSNSYDTYDHSKFCKYLKKNLEKLQLINADKDMISEFFTKAIS